MPFEALTPLAPLSQGERGENTMRHCAVRILSLLSLWERRVGVVRAATAITD